jgi:hypothetical protein
VAGCKRPSWSVADGVDLTRALLGNAMLAGMPAPPPTPRLAFRDMTPDDLDDMAALLGDPQIMRYYPPQEPRRGALLDRVEPAGYTASTALGCGCSRCATPASSSATAA